ncbi:MAG TPA: hypothetical protein VEK08_00385 [Planctomycetota bacterium]|nr:hypothetical protein [Planctomycetota bacterium]
MSFRTVWHITDAKGRTHQAKTEDAYHATVQRLRAELGEDAELEIFATVDIETPERMGSIMGRVLNEAQAAREGGAE